jgi:hypothetical protein
MISEVKQRMGIIEDAGARIITTGIVGLKVANPEAWSTFKVALQAVAEGSTKLVRVTDNDDVSAQEIEDVLQSAASYGSARVLQDILWSLVKHVKG